MPTVPCINWQDLSPKATLLVECGRDLRLSDDAHLCALQPSFVQRKSEIWHAAADATNVGQGIPHALVVVADGDYIDDRDSSLVAATRRAVGSRAKTGYKADMPSDNLAGTRVAGSKDPEASYKNKGQHYEVAEILRIDGRCGLHERADSAHVGTDIQDGGRDILSRNRASAVLNQNSAAVGRDQRAWLLPCAHAQPIGSLIGRAKHEYTPMLRLLNSIVTLRMLAISPAMN
ncbi:hypothetical protein SASPL_121050 [Salvia splendens]|uniref:Uncharacterized protein n=1 Tax=Salvia splendens TaxID=180675 RepID=A0A8X8ZWV0_SALSN|nr:hypothetical protein SASPL_121050 [Salvia splendens]